MLIQRDLYNLWGQRGLTEKGHFGGTPAMYMFDAGGDSSHTFSLSD
ncbi:hypothetical protein THTE_4378 [Thermogutta terrifontis]|uniref:Uncharacterized protein n=1 Tax=Thermogutta terrifontis TaxID=1331910 RepID=A0A286RLZ0_9BACT|nr:hypothetical protein THTE_4378 [Thermogutta terrifontis]